MERPQLEEHVSPKEIELQKALPNAFSRIYNLYFPEQLRFHFTNNAGDLFRL